MKRFITTVVAVIMITTIIFTGPLPANEAQAATSTEYYIQVDITNQHVTVFRKSDMVIVRQMICSTGTNATPTPQGTYIMPPKGRVTERQKWYTFADCYAQYASRIRGPYLFHSYLFSAKNDNAVIQSSVRALGSQASHGCIRLRIADAKWIAKNCLSGTKVKIFKSGKRNDEIRKLLLKKSYSINCGKSYEEWAGIGGKGELGRGDVGPKVLQLQKRLVGMGYAHLTADGIYGQNTLDGVKAFQKKVGLEADGVADQKTWDALFADDAPAGSAEVTLYEGTSGAIVRELQETLTVLKFYDGAVDGEFDSDVTKALNLYRKTHNMSENGKISHSRRQDANDEAEALLKKFGDKDYRIVFEDYEVPMARVKKSKSHIYMRKKESTTAKKLLKLTKLTEMNVVEKGDTWTKVTKSDKTGYVQTKYIKFFSISKQRVRYELIDAPTVPPETEPVVTPTPAPVAPPEDAA
jgi:peptidoglycan hydrolase-like protein with peptidoglycan-binding domain